MHHSWIGFLAAAGFAAIANSTQLLGEMTAANQQMFTLIQYGAATTCKCGKLVRATATKSHACTNCGKLLQIGGPQGLGDSVKGLLDKIGGKQAKAAFKKLTGRDCKCQERKQKLNEIFPYNN